MTMLNTSATNESVQAEADNDMRWLQTPGYAENVIMNATEPEQSRQMESVSAAAIAWAKEQHNYEMVVRATRYYLLARRKTTELLIANNMRVIDDMQFTPMQWSRRMKEYNVPINTLDNYFDGCIANGWNPSIAGMLKEAYHMEDKPEKETIKDKLIALRHRILSIPSGKCDADWIAAELTKIIGDDHWSKKSEAE